jgi:SAM-dependent methyltransferase
MPPWRGWLYSVLARMGAHLERAGKGLRFAGIGILTRDEFLHRVRSEYDTYRAMDEETLGGLSWWERDVYERFLDKNDRVLIVGAGTGRDVLALAAAGHAVVGLDCLPGPLATAQRHLDAGGYTATLIAGAIEDGAPLPGPFNMIIFSEKTYTLIAGAAQRRRALERARQLLAPGGRIVVTYFGTAVEQPQRGVGIARLASAVTRSDWRLEPHDIVESRGPRGGVLHYHHVFTEAEFAAEAQAAGLRIVFRREPADPPTAVLVAER